VFLSHSNGAFLGVFVGVVVFALLQRSWRAAAVLALAGAAAAVGLAVAAAARGSQALQVSAGERLENWRVALDAFVDAPLFGHGLFRFAPAYLERRTPDDNITRYAHSLPLQWLAETGVAGVIGGVVAAVVIAKGFVEFSWLRRHDNKRAPGWPGCRRRRCSAASNGCCSPGWRWHWRGWCGRW
jgi:O-antigen ligase